MYPMSGSLDFPIRDWRAITNAFAALDYTDRTWEGAEAPVASGRIVYELIEEGVRLPASGERSLRFRASGRGTYVGTEGTEDEQGYCLGAWSGTWEVWFHFESIATAADGTLSLDLWISSASAEAITMHEACEPLEYLPWHGDEVGRLSFAPGDTDAGASRGGDDIDRVVRSYGIEFLTLLPDRD